MVGHPTQVRTPVGPGEPVAVPLSARDRELIIYHSFADSDLTDRLRLDPETDEARIFYFTLDELDDLIGFVASEANHCAKKAHQEWQLLYDRLAALLDSYTSRQSAGA